MDENVPQLTKEELQKKIQKLENDLAKYSVLKDSAGFAIMTLKSYVFIDCNQMAEKIFGLSRHEIVGKEPFILSPKYQPDGESSQEKAIELIDSALTGENMQFEWEHVRGDGSRFYADVSLNKVRVGAEELVQVMLRDISNEKLSKERLENQNRIIRHLNKKYQRQNEDYEKLVEEIRKHQELNTAILRNISDGVAVFNEDRFIYINDQMLYMLGLANKGISPEDFFEQLGHNYHEIKWPESSDDVYEGWPHGFDNDKYFRMQILAMSDPGAYMVHVADYTQIKNVHKSIEESEYKFRSIFHSSTDSIILMSDDLLIREVNETFVQKFKHNTFELSGKHIKELIKSNMEDEFIEWLSTTENEQFNLTEFEMNSSKGEEIPVEVGCRNIKIGSSSMYLLIVRDISYRKKFEQQMILKILEAEEQERKRIAANLHDELGPVLSSMKLYNNTLKEKADDQLHFLSDQFEELITEAVETVRLLSEDLSPVSLYKGGIDKALQKRLHALKGFYHVDFESSIGDLRFSEQVEINVYRIFNELINNTMKHAGATLINIGIQYKNKKLYLKYSDNGVGFNPEDKVHEMKGRGLGNIRGRLKSMNATFKSSTEKGKGVSFEIQAPVEAVRE